MKLLTLTVGLFVAIGQFKQAESWCIWGEDPVLCKQCLCYDDSDCSTGETCWTPQKLCPENNGYCKCATRKFCYGCQIAACSAGGGECAAINPCMYCENNCCTLDRQCRPPLVEQDLTWQFRDFNALLDKHPFHMLAFPCNQFQLEEPTYNEEILNALQYVRPGKGYIPHKNLTIFGKIDVNGEKEHPLYTFLKATCAPPYPILGDPTRAYRQFHYDPITISDINWNYEKFIIDSNGKPKYRFLSPAWGEGGSFFEKHLVEVIGQGRSTRMSSGNTATGQQFDAQAIIDAIANILN